jgi:hypothetical protein
MTQPLTALASRSVYAGVTLALLAGACGPGHSSQQETSNYDAKLAALGEATLMCLGTVTPNSYAVQDGVLVRQFEQCVDGTTPSSIDNILMLQRYAGAPGYGAALTSAWQRFRDSLGSELSDGACPTWHKLETLQAPTREQTLSTREQVGESFSVWAVTAEGCADNACAVERAAQCAAGFGDAFVVATNAATGRVTTDPVYWEYETVYPPETNPFRPPYYHRPSYYGFLPGDLFGAVQRAGEECTRYVNGYHWRNHYWTPIVCDDRGTADRADDIYCAAECMSPAQAEAQGLDQHRQW